MATPFAKDTLPESKTVTGDGTGELLGGLLAKAVLFFDAEGRAVAAHCEVDRLRPWTASLLHKPLRLLPAPLREIVEQSLSNAENAHHREIPIPSASGVLEMYHASSAPAHAANGKVCGATVSIYDLSPVRELDQNLAQLVRLASIGTLSAGMAHEIKNAMVAVNTFVDILVNKHHDSELAPIVSREIRRIDNIVAQMLRVSGPKRLVFQMVKLHELLEHALSVAQHRLAGSRILLERRLEADPDLVMGDGSQLEQAFVNLLFNAIEAMGNHGKLTVASELTRRDDNTPIIRLTVKDTGTGITPECLDRLFEPFFTTKTTGHGLGLVITRRIVLDHRGTISVQSWPGEGTVFTVDIPSASRQP
jgi:two-component system nitrogen regulation sensor histidine kinase GlnL